MQALCSHLVSGETFCMCSFRGCALRSVKEAKDGKKNGRIQEGN